MSRLSDMIYERSVIAQMHFSEEENPCQRSSADAALIRDAAGQITTLRGSVLLPVMGNISGEEMLAPVRKEFMVRGAALAGFRAELMVPEDTAEEVIRNTVIRLTQMHRAENLVCEGITVHRSQAVKEPLMLLQASGPMRSLREAPWQLQELIPGETIVVTGYPGLSETIEAVRADEGGMSGYFSKAFLKKTGARLPERLPYVELEVAPFFSVTAMRQITEGGLVAALMEFGYQKDYGFRLDKHAVPLLQETIEVAEFLNRNPFEMRGEGAYLLATKRGEDLVMALQSSGIPAAAIGVVTEDKARGFFGDGEEQFLDVPRYEKKG